LFLNDGSASASAVLKIKEKRDIVGFQEMGNVCNVGRAH
jgi:hypothetical protein